MAKAIEAYVDARGKVHSDATDAIVADLAAALGRVGEQTGMAEGVARVILERRTEIERAFRELDELRGEGEAPEPAGTERAEDDAHVIALGER